MKNSIAAAAVLAVLLQFSFLTISFACNIDSFIFEEFGQRCIRMADCIKNLQVAYRFNLPDHDEHKRKLLNEWTAFYLDHGQAPPPGIPDIATASWKETFTSTGNQIGLLSYRKIEPAEADWATIPFLLLAQPTKFSQGREILASWSKILQIPPQESIASEAVWIGNNMANLAQIARMSIIESETENARISALVRDINASWGYVVSADNAVQETLFRFSRDEIRAKLKKEFERWRKLFFM